MARWHLPALPIPPETLQYPHQRHLWPLLPVQNCFDDGRSEQGQAQDAREVGRRDPLALASSAMVANSPDSSIRIPSECTGQRLDQRVVRLVVWPERHRAGVFSSARRASWMVTVSEIGVARVTRLL